MDGGSGAKASGTRARASGTTSLRQEIIIMRL